MPAVWSPGVAVAGIFRVNGTTVRPRAGTVTEPLDMVSQVPASSDFPPAASTSKPPPEVVNASLA